MKQPQQRASRRATKRHTQGRFVFRTWGGARKGAGRKPKGSEPGVSHRRRPVLGATFPVHVTLRVLPHVWNLRSRRGFTIFSKAVLTAAHRFAMRVCQFSVQGNHIHLVVEATHQAALGQGMKGLGVRLAKGLNKLMDRRGRVLADRYHAHILRTPSEVRRAVHYVLHNYRKHVVSRGGTLAASYVDPYSSASCEHGIVLPRAHTWPLRDLRPDAGEPQ